MKPITREEALTEPFIRNQREQILALLDRTEELESAIATHRAQKADDRCIEDDDRLYASLGDGVKCDRRVGDKAAMLGNCARFIERRCEGGGWPTYAEMEARVEQLEDTITADTGTYDGLKVERDAALAQVAALREALDSAKFFWRAEYPGEGPTAQMVTAALVNTAEAAKAYEARMRAATLEEAAVLFDRQPHLLEKWKDVARIIRELALAPVAPTHSGGSAATQDGIADEMTVPGAHVRGSMRTSAPRGDGVVVSRWRLMEFCTSLAAQQAMPDESWRAQLDALLKESE